MNNISNVPIRVVHADLERFGDGAYKSKCPACKNGILLVARDASDDFKLVRLDICIHCAQQFYYTDATINGEEFTEKVPYPLFEIVGPPCPAPGCSGVLTPIMSLKTKEWFYECHICHGEFNRVPIEDRFEWAAREKAN